MIRSIVEHMAGDGLHISAKLLATRQMIPANAMFRTRFAVPPVGEDGDGESAERQDPPGSVEGDEGGPCGSGKRGSPTEGISSTAVAPFSFDLHATVEDRV